MSIDQGSAYTYRENYPTPGIAQPTEQFRINFGIIRTAIENLQDAKSDTRSVMKFSVEIGADGKATLNGTFYTLADTPSVPGALAYSNGFYFWDGTGWVPLINGISPPPV